MTIDATAQDGIVPFVQTLIEVNQDGIRLGVGHSVDILGALKVEVRAPGTAAAGGVADISPLSGIVGLLSADGATLVSNATSQQVLIEGLGQVLVDTTAGRNPAMGVFEAFGPHVVNHGLILVTGGTDATGVFITDVQTDTGTLVNNSGAITVISNTGVATGLQAQGQHDVINSGRIEATGFTGSVGALVGPGTAFLNSGTITATDMPSATGAVAVEYVPSQAWSFTNSGTITGDFALSAVAGPPTPPVGAAIVNSGQMNGLVVLGAGADVLTNSGTINGPMNLGDGNDLYDGRLGTETGLLQGGAGNDTELGGAGFDNLQGNQGDDSLSGGAGDDFVVGGKDNDQQFGDAGNDIVWGNLGNDTLDGGDGNDQVRGGQGDDVLNGGAGDDFVSGDRGNDTITGGVGADIFHGSQDAGIDKVMDFNLAEGDRVMLDPGTAFTIHQVGADTVIDMGPSASGAPNQMILVGVQMSTLTGSWIFGA